LGEKPAKNRRNATQEGALRKHLRHQWEYLMWVLHAEASLKGLTTPQQAQLASADTSQATLKPTISCHQSSTNVLR